MSYTAPTRTFTHSGKSLRVFSVQGRPWFVAKDICILLGTSRNASQVANAMPEAHRMKMKIQDRLPVNMIDVEGLMDLLRRSTKADEPDSQGNVFRKWISGEVLPSLKTLKEPAEVSAHNEGPVSRTEMDHVIERLTALETKIHRLERRTKKR